jgi:hypothetical protein
MNIFISGGAGFIGCNLAHFNLTGIPPSGIMLRL